MPVLRVVDAFAGIGGLGAATVAVGAETELCVDNDPNVLSLYRINWRVPEDRCICRTLTTAVLDALDEWPQAVPGVHFHWSAPCTRLSNATHDTTEEDRDAALALFQTGIVVALRKGYAVWSVEQVSTPQTRALAARWAAAYPSRVAHATLDASEFGGASRRKRLIVAPPELIERLQAAPRSTRSAAEAFATNGLTVPEAATHLKTSTTTGGIVRPVSLTRVAPTVTASRPLTFCTHTGETVSCLTPAHSAALMGFPSTTKLPSQQRDAQRAVGNALEVHFATAMLQAAIEVVDAAAPMPPPLPDVGLLAASEPGAAPAGAPEAASSPSAARRRLKKRVRACVRELRKLARLL